MTPLASNSNAATPLAAKAGEADTLLPSVSPANLSAGAVSPHVVCEPARSSSDAIRVPHRNFDAWTTRRACRW